MKVLITGAHFTPAVAVAEELRKFEGVEIVYVGRKTTQEGFGGKSVESEVLPKKGVKFIPIIAGRLQRAFTIYTIPSLLKIPVGFLHALFIILREKPDVILSFGGYVAVPVVIMGWFFSIPVIVHEQTLVSGLANTLSSFFADKIAVSFPASIKGEKVVLTGNPIRHEIIQKSLGAKLIHPPGGRKVRVVLVTGGNQGSHVINLAVEECLRKLIRIAKVIHVTGESKFKDFERLERLRESEELRERYVVNKWIGEEWGETLREVDLVVSRAGINTLSEMAYLGKPGLVIPIPYLYEDEQNKNALFFEKSGLVNILPQSRLSGESLFSNISEMLKNLKKLKDKANAAKKLIIPDAAKKLALETILLANRKHD